MTQTLFYLALKQSVRSVLMERPFVIEAFVLLPDHLHCIWTLPPNDADYATRWNMIKRRVSQQVRDVIDAPLAASRHKRAELGLWQRRFWEHQIRDDRDMAKHANYIHWNPVKHGYVKQVKDWPYSSFHKFVEKGYYPPDWAGMPHESEQPEIADFGEMD